jgi:hypothetical protein
MALPGYHNGDKTFGVDDPEMVQLVSSKDTPVYCFRHFNRKKLLVSDYQVATGCGAVKR